MFIYLSKKAGAHGSGAPCDHGAGLSVVDVMTLARGMTAGARRVGRERQHLPPTGRRGWPTTVARLLLGPLQRWQPSTGACTLPGSKLPVLQCSSYGMRG
jgi:hypothetical protein